MPKFTLSSDAHALAAQIAGTTGINYHTQQGIFLLIKIILSLSFSMAFSFIHISFKDLVTL
jgi:hypothetical protein